MDGPFRFFASIARCRVSDERAWTQLDYEFSNIWKPFIQGKVTLGKSDPPWVTPAGCDREVKATCSQAGAWKRVQNGTPCCFSRHGVPSYILSPTRGRYFAGGFSPSDFPVLAGGISGMASLGG